MFLKKFGILCVSGLVLFSLVGIGCTRDKHKSVDEQTQEFTTESTVNDSTLLELLKSSKRSLQIKEVNELLKYADLCNSVYRLHLFRPVQEKKEDYKKRIKYKYKKHYKVYADRVEDKLRTPSHGYKNFFLLTSKEDSIQIIAIEGTSAPGDIIRDLTYFNAQGEISMHTGFKDLAEKVYSKVKSEITAKHIFVTGHSLGGAAAAILGFFLEKDFPKSNILAITFGQPRFTNFEENKEKCGVCLAKNKLLRVYSVKDPITILPPFSLSKKIARNGIYAHYGSKVELETGKFTPESKDSDHKKMLESVKKNTFSETRKRVKHIWKRSKNLKDFLKKLTSFEKANRDIGASNDVVQGILMLINKINAHGRDSYIQGLKKIVSQN